MKKIRKKTRKNAKKRGGNPIEQHLRNLFDLAIKMTKNELFDNNYLKTTLDNLFNPLHMKLLEHNNIFYSINEIALYYNLPPSVHNLFCNYNVDLNHYSFYNTNEKFKNGDVYEPLNLLEAYCSYGNYSNNVECILNQIIKTYNTTNDINAFNCMYHYLPNYNVPILINIICYNLNLYPAMISTYNHIIDIYATIPHINMLMSLPKKHPKFYNLLNIIQIIILCNYVYAFDKICNLFKNDKKTLSSIIIMSSKYFIIVDTNDMYITAMDFITTINDDLLKTQLQTSVKNINDAECFSLNEYVNAYKNSNAENKHIYAKRFFEKILISSKNNNYKFKNKDDESNTSIIIVCHGEIIGKKRKKYIFPFKSLCFYTEKGKILSSSCKFKRTEAEFICNDSIEHMECLLPVNNNILIDQMQYIFENKRNFGIFLCNNNTNVSINDSIMPNQNYAFDTLIRLCLKICDDNGLDSANISIKLFTCRGYSNNTNSDVVEAVPRVVLKTYSPEFERKPNPFLPDNIKPLPSNIFDIKSDINDESESEPESEILPKKPKLK